MRSAERQNDTCEEERVNWSLQYSALQIQLHADVGKGARQVTNQGQ